MSGSSRRPLAADPRLAELLYAWSGEDHVRRLQRGYLAIFEGARSVVDVGSGRGIFLDLLRDHGIAAVGVEVSREAAQSSRERGHEVLEAEAIAALRELARTQRRFDGVLCSHVIEHLMPEVAIDLVEAMAGVLSPGGRAVVVTPNPSNLKVLSHSFWLDPTHVRPYPRPLLERIGRAVGLDVERSFDDPATQRGSKLLRALRKRILGGRFDGPSDSVVVYRKP
jgi:O-antigen chain-terminating methyltransferase